MLNTDNNNISLILEKDICKKYPHLELFASIKKDIEIREQKKKESLQCKDMVFVNANLRNFLPSIQEEDYMKVYTDVLFYRGLLNQETNSSSLVQELELESLECKLDDHLPAIFCAYHLGSYRSIIGILASKGIDFSLVVDEKTFVEQEDKIKKQVEDFCKTFDTDIDFEILNAESKKASIELRNQLVKGKSLVIYIDGNSGVGGVHARNSRVQLKVPFLNQNVFSRKGIAVLSWITNRPIIPVISYYQEGRLKPTIDFLEPILPSQWPGKNMKTYIPEVTEKLYNILGEYVQKYPTQWEGWLYVHKYLDQEELATNNEKQGKGKLNNATFYGFNRSDYDLFKMEEDCFLLNKNTYKTLEISEGLLDTLNVLEIKKEEELIEMGFTNKLLSELVEERILQPSENLQV